MSLSLYLHDCADSDTLIVLLQQSGHRVNTPRLAGTLGASDRVHLEYAARNRQTLLTKDPADFLELHTEWQARQHSHSGILLVYEEKDLNKNLTLKQIVIAVNHLVTADVPLKNQVHILNHWR